MRVKHRSIRVDIRTSLYTLTLFLILPVAISLIVMLYSADSYQRSISRMETVTSIMPVISEQIPEYMWSVVAGRQSFEDGDVYGTIDRVNTTLNSLIASVPQGQYIELSVARRTMETLRDYVSQIETGMTMGRRGMRSHSGGGAFGSGAHSGDAQQLHLARNRPCFKGRRGAAQGGASGHLP